MIIGLCGLKGSGKDTVAAYLIKEYGYERKAFADKLKLSAAALFGINSSEWETLKNDDTAVVTLRNIHDELGNFTSIAEITVREFLQRYGTESHRDVFGNNFWVDQVLPVGGYYADRDIVITDVRYFGEGERIHNLKGYVARVNRDSSDTSDPHSSETEQSRIEVDYELDNNGELKHLPKKIDEMLAELAIRRIMV
jgi:hypothetical protein